MRHILLADDDTELTELLAEYLTAYDIKCDIADDGAQALAKIQAGHYDLVVLDIMMPQLDGLTVLKQLPSENAPPVIMLTARGEEIDRIVGLELGADDYLAKPCNPRELLARINAVIKRSQHHVPHVENKTDSRIKLDSNTRQCHIDNELIALTGTEFDLLHALLQHHGGTIDKASLSEHVLQRELQPFDRSIDVHISRLRKKLSPYHDDPIKAIRGKGYQLAI